MSDTLKAIDLLKDKLQKLLVNYEFLKEENEVLLQENTKLTYLLKNKEEELQSKDEAYSLLKVAKTIEGSKEDTRATKLKINALVREIDKCIELLNN